METEMVLFSTVLTEAKGRALISLDLKLFLLEIIS